MYKNPAMRGFLLLNAYEGKTINIPITYWDIMKFTEINNVEKDDSVLFLSNTCSQFIEQSNGLPMMKHLQGKVDDVCKVKVRFRKNFDKSLTTFNEAFSSELQNIRQRAVFANGTVPENKPIDEVFYVFPINGFKFMYNKEVKTSAKEYKHAFDTILEQFGDKEKEANKLIMDLLQYTYTSENLCEGISCGSELLIYNIPYYYAVRTTTYEKYGELLTSIQS